MERWSPKARARLSGVFELIEGQSSVFGQMTIPGMLIVTSDAAATANGILANEGLYRLAIALSLIAVVFHLAWGLMLNDLLGVVDRTVARFALLLLGVSSAVQVVAALLLFGPLAVLRGTTPLEAFNTAQLQSLAYVFLRLNDHAYNVFLALFGVWLAAIGYLVFSSTFLPRLIGLGLILEGLGWCAFFAPPIGNAIFPVIIAFGVIGELPLLLWMLIRGVDNEKWRQRAAESAP